MTKTTKILWGVIPFVLGIVIGLWFCGIEKIIPTRDFISDRMAQCSQTLRIQERAEQNNDAALKRIILGDMNQCRVLVENYSYKIAEEDMDVVERIKDAAE